MKILQLHLLAFGPFTDTIIDLEQGNEGLHIIYGPNEAGKSSALRALRQMLYGIPARSSDNFIHPHIKMRIGGCIRKKDGTVLDFIRRKGRKNTLRNREDSAVIDESRLEAFLSGVDENLFSTMFGINHPGLVQGGEEIIQGGGNMGQILFAAGAGISDFRKIQIDLREEAGSLFKPAAKKPRINAAITEYNKTRKEIRNVQLNSQEWVKHDRSLRKAEKRKQEIERELARQIGERNRLERIINALPDIAMRKELLEEYQEFAKAVLLSEDFGEKRRQAVTHLRVTENEAAQAEKNIEEMFQALKELNVPESLLENAEVIELLYKKLGEYLKDILDRPRIIGLQSSARSEAKTILSGINSDIPLEQAAQLQPKKAEKVKIQELGSVYEKLRNKKENIKNEIIKLTRKKDQLKNHLSSLSIPPNTTELQKTVERIRKMGDMEAHYEAEYFAIKKAEEAAFTALKKMTLWKGSLEDIAELPVPLAETIDIFEERLSKSQEAIRKFREEMDLIEQRLEETGGRIEQIRLEHEVPTEDDLNMSRIKRDDKWRDIKKSSFPLSNEIAEAYESSVRYADDIGDRLRREADRVAQKAALLSSQDTLRNRRNHVSTHLKNAESEFYEIEAQWCDLWKSAGISPKSPREMRAWAQKQAVLSNQAAELKDRKAGAEAIRKRISMCFQDLNNCLISLKEAPALQGEPLAHVLERSQNFLGNMEKIRTRHEQLLSAKEEQESELKQAQVMSAECDEELSIWRSQWAKSLQPLGLDADTSPAQANAVLEDLNTLSFKLKELDGFRKRIEGIDRDTREYDVKVKEFAGRESPDLLKLPVDQIVAELSSRLTKAREAKTREQSLKKQQSQEEKRLAAARNRMNEIHARLDAMCGEAGCDKYEALPLAEERSRERRQIEARLEECGARLRKLSAGAPLEAFVQEIENTDPDTIAPRMNLLSEEIEQINQEKSELDQTIGSERTELSKMDGSAKAAELEEQAQGVLARLESDVEQYVRLKLASSVLNQAIERYREKNQGPILKRSNELFSHMTLGSFEGLRLEFNEKNEAVIAGVRPGGSEIVHVEGMSDGTADQLYLAVRLATLESWLEKKEPLPFIVDDILIKFDDRRAAATLQVLAELSQKTQVIFFTHHRHLVELAQKNIQEDMLFTHQLNGDM